MERILKAYNPAKNSTFNLHYHQSTVCEGHTQSSRRISKHPTGSSRCRGHSLCFCCVYLRRVLDSRHAVHSSLPVSANSFSTDLYPSIRHTLLMRFGVQCFVLSPPIAQFFSPLMRDTLFSAALPTIPIFFSFTLPSSKFPFAYSLLHSFIPLLISNPSLPNSASFDTRHWTHFTVVFNIETLSSVLTQFEPRLMLAAPATLPHPTGDGIIVLHLEVTVIIKYGEFRVNLISFDEATTSS
ncbi:hypothetical protein BLNAU_913 [Blattamonas nauphoetae]|uniref:Uncharacterized protein n=1 Tax=Blattamonas nauphoetae TaxID=2049346 RepID=A0ABQ9YKU6_9EUKA|nr:hypothetical protein BLNAU_913 [Blattamonas nauphoetae]